MKHPMDHKIKRPFVWTSSAATDVSKTFARERARLKALAAQAEKNAQEVSQKAVPIRKVAAK